jgi:hypothetical protein
MSAEAYLLLRTSHLTFVSLSLALFVLRGWWHWAGSPLRNSRWATVVPHVNDTLLLLAGISLAITLRQYPFEAPWLTVGNGRTARLDAWMAGGRHLDRFGHGVRLRGRGGVQSRPMALVRVVRLDKA